MQSPLEVDFIGIGSGKSGSTWLYENLVKHPQIYDQNLKELNYFSDLYDEHPYAWYEAQFASCRPGQLKGEFSVTYMAHPLAPERIRRHLPRVKLLAIVRNPVQRTYSNYLHSLRKGDVPPSVPFSEYIQSEQNLAPARYSEHLERWYACFDPSQIRVLVLEEIVKDMPATYRGIYAFLGVNDQNFLPPNTAQRLNEARFYRYLWLESALVQSYRWLSRKGHTRFVKQIINTGIADRIRRLNKVDKPLPKLDEASTERLQRYFDPFNAKLGQLLGRELKPWDVARSS